jgi:muconolactone delta-isomerase
MGKQSEAERLADSLSADAVSPIDLKAAAELRRLHAENELLMNALWKACGDDEEVVKATIESQR